MDTRDNSNLRFSDSWAFDERGRVRLANVRGVLSDPTPEEIDKVIRWSQQNTPKNDFWFKIILSTEKLRKNYDQLWLQMNNDKPAVDNGGRKPTKEYTKENIHELYEN